MVLLPKNWGRLLMGVELQYAFPKRTKKCFLRKGLLTLNFVHKKLISQSKKEMENCIHAKLRIIAQE